MLYCRLALRSAVEPHCFCSRIANEFGEIRRRKWPIPICLESASGLADPVPILHTLMANPFMHKRYAPDAVVTCVDQVNHERTVVEDPVAMSQIQLADVVILTKGDLATAEQRRARREFRARGERPSPAD
ncbi:GTP-binding protein [Roseiarcus sp.]|uniref:GTP-binding protein n=1 Tax=Roseiarcus sp. TaxID=1969460 RepID=UPI003F9D96B1